ncbi:MAG: hypothetical protein IH624_01200 [Phycisphaerae bacterium]|nr:hypothetical protein [Phycisphaerae bacterium]
MAELTENGTRHSILRIWTAAALWAMIAIFAGHACTHMVAAGDTWVAMACGRHFVEHGVDTVEPFSFNSHKAGPTQAQLERFPEWTRPIIQKIHPTGWINQNWLTHVIFYRMAQAFGTDGDYDYNALVYWKFGVTFLCAVCVYYIGRVMGASAPWAAAGACFAVFVGRTFIDIRPAVFSNVLVAAYLLILVLATYRNFHYIWLIVPLLVFWCNVHGGYVYAFMMLVVFAGIHFVTIPFRKVFPSIGFKGVLHTAGAGLVAFLAMLIFNPFHLTNLTHTFEISISKHAESWRTVNEWHGAFEWNNPVGEETAFLVMFILMFAAMGLWIVAMTLRPRVETRRRARGNGDPIPGTFEWPKVDLAYIAIAIYTVSMAVKMRRFIPLAGVAMCPLMALFLDHAVKMIGARVQFNRTGRLDLPALPARLRWAVPAGFTVAAVLLGTLWGARYKHVYLDPWANDDVRDSVFMRMTASNIKPFEVCWFIRENNLSGRIFNHWTEGGAVAFGQHPDEKTGEIPLKLFMDGRAQAAYNHDKFKLWQYIKSGGPQVRSAFLAKRKLAYPDFEKIGAWIDAQLKEHDVWVILMPVNEINSDFMMGMQTQTNWRTAYMDNYQFLLINKETPQGQQLLDDILNQKARFPNDFSKELTLAKNLLAFRDEALSRRGLEHAIRSFEVDNSQAPMQLLVHDAAMRHAHLRAAATAFIVSYLDRFISNKHVYATQGGYTKKLVAAMIAANYLAGTPNPEYKEKYGGLDELYKEEQQRIGQKARW